MQISPHSIHSSAAVIKGGPKAWSRYLRATSAVFRAQPRTVGAGNCAGHRCERAGVRGGNVAVGRSVKRDDIGVSYCFGRGIGLGLVENGRNRVVPQGICPFYDVDFAAPGPLLDCCCPCCWPLKERTWVKLAEAEGADRKRTAPHPRGIWSISKMYTPSPKRSLDTIRTDSRPGVMVATFLSSARIVKVLSAIKHALDTSWYVGGAIYSMIPIRRTEQSFHQRICIVHSVMFIDSNDKYELHNSTRKIRVCKEICSDARMSNLLTVGISLPTESVHKLLSDKRLSQRYLRVQPRSMQREEHESELACRRNVVHDK